MRAASEGAREKEAENPHSNQKANYEINSLTYPLALAGLGLGLLRGERILLRESFCRRVGTEVSFFGRRRRRRRRFFFFFCRRRLPTCRKNLTSSSRCAAFSSYSCSFQVRRSTLATPTGVAFFFSSAALMRCLEKKREKKKREESIRRHQPRRPPKRKEMRCSVLCSLYPPLLPSLFCFPFNDGRRRAHG